MEIFENSLAPIFILSGTAVAVPDFFFVECPCNLFNGASNCHGVNALLSCYCEMKDR